MGVGRKMAMLVESSGFKLTEAIKIWGSGQRLELEKEAPRAAAISGNLVIGRTAHEA